MSNKAIERLHRLATPHQSPSYGSGDWEAIERELGLQLPKEYKYLVNSYGQGCFVGEAFCSGLLISSYLGPTHGSERAEGFAEYLRTLEKPLLYGIYPDKPGLLGFGSYADKDTIAWHTSGEPEQWEIVYHDPESGFHEIKGMGFLEFVISFLEESSPLHKSGVIRKGNMKGPHTFRPES